MTTPTMTAEIRTCYWPFDKLLATLARTRDHLRSQKEETEIPPGDALDALAFERRRLIIEYLVEDRTGDVVDVSDVAEFVASRENGCSVEEITSDERQRAYVSAIQQHCPKLQQLGFVHYDSDRKTLRPTERLGRVWDAYGAFYDELNH